MVELKEEKDIGLGQDIKLPNPALWVQNNSIWKIPLIAIRIQESWEKVLGSMC